MTKELNFSQSSDDLVGAGIKFIRPSKLAEAGETGVILVGEYVKRVPNSVTSKEDFEFLDNEGRTVILNSTGHFEYLANSMKLNPGQVCRVTYKGKNLYKGKETHEFKLEIAE